MRNKQWVEVRKGADYPTICRQFDISPVLARLIRNRGICDQTAIENFLYGSLSMLADPDTLPDMAEAGDLLADAIDAGAPVRIIGDYDVDGVCATYCLLEGLKGLGAQVDADIPDRKKDGYGINDRLIEQAVRDGIEVIVTCDNGIGAHAAVDAAVRQGLSVIVTDHHEIGPEGLPQADAVIDPKRADSEFAQRDICGAAVAWQVMRSLYRKTGQAPEALDELLPFVAMATVCDVVPLTGDSRIIVREGIARMKRTEHTGLSALIEACGIERDKISAYHMGFILGPCINACGRMTSAKDALSLLCETDPEKAAKKASLVRLLNERRKQLTDNGLEEALKAAEEAVQRGDKVLVLDVPSCDESVAGIVAGRVKEAYYQPSILLTGEQDGLIKGSGRSVPGYDLFQALNANADLFEKFGGHEQAAGLTIRADRIDELRAALNGADAPDDEVLREKLAIDMVLPFQMCTLAQAEELVKLEPCGMSNKKALFATRHVSIKRVRIFGRERQVLALDMCDQAGQSLRGVVFSDVPAFTERIRQETGVDLTEEGAQLDRIRLTAAYSLGVNEYGGERSAQAVIRDVLIES